jgi:CHASE3 domain sensor protein
MQGWDKVKDFFLSNPTLVVTLLYLYVTAFGMFYSALLYGKFGINIFDYSEVADFLLAGFKNWIAFVSAALLAATGVALAVYTTIRVKNQTRALRTSADVAKTVVDAELAKKEDLADQRQRDTGKGSLREKYEEYLRKMAVAEASSHRIEDPDRGRWFEEQIREIDESVKNDARKLLESVGEEEETLRKRLRERMVLIITMVPVSIFLSSVLLPYYSATTTASEIKQGEHTVVDVRYRSFKGSAGQVTVPGLELIGATQKAAFFYDVDGERTIVIPQAQIVSIEVPAQD